MFKNNISQFNDLCPIEAAKNFIKDKLFDLGVAGKRLEKLDSSDFTQLEIDFITGCLIAHNDYCLDFISESEDFFEIKRSIVNFMLSPGSYGHAEFLLISRIKRICTDHYINKIENMIEELKAGVYEDLLEYFEVKNETN